MKNMQILYSNEEIEREREIHCFAYLMYCHLVEIIPLMTVQKDIIIPDFNSFHLTDNRKR